MGNKNSNIRTLYHGSSVEFDIFNRMGDRSTSALGAGYYLTPDVNKARAYGAYVMVFDVDVSECLDWDNLAGEQREEVEQLLMTYVPETELSKYGEVKHEVLPLDSSGLKRFRELQGITSENSNDSAKARMLTKSELPDELLDVDTSKFGIACWKEASGLDSATNEQLLALAQEYAPEIARHLGYSGAMFSTEISIYESSLATKIGLLESPDCANTFDKLMQKAIGSVSVSADGEDVNASSVFREARRLRM